MRDIRVRNLPMGYEFRPTDKELVDYLKMKIQGFDSEVDEVIPMIDIYKFEPENLPDKSKIRSDDPEWFFISPPEKKYRKSKRNNRATNLGHWKVTGKERDVTDRTTADVVAKKRTLVFYEGHSKNNKRAKKTDWVLHEYHLIKPLPNQKELSLYRLRNKSFDNIDTPKCEDSEPSSHVTTDFEDQGIFDCEKNVEVLTKLKAILDEVYPKILHDPSFAWLQEDFPEKEANVLDGSSSYSIPFSEIQQEQDTTMNFTSFLNNQEEHYNDETDSCFNGYNQQTSLKRSYDDGRVSSDIDTEAIQRRVKNRYSCAIA